MSDTVPFFVPIFRGGRGNPAALFSFYSASYCLSDDQRVALAALWKEENKKKTGPKPQGIAAQRCAAIKDRHPTRAKTIEIFNVPQWKIDEASKLLTCCA